MTPAYAEWSRNGAQAFEKTFILSNVVPQYHGMNAGIWEDLEDNIAGQCKGGRVEDEGYAGRFRNITVINGPIYEGQVDKLRNGTWVPSACFSIVLDFLEDSGKYRAMAFEIPNKEDVKGPLLKWSTTIRKIEDKTGLDIFEGNEDVRIELETMKPDKIW
jgi:endonuclease G